MLLISLIKELIFFCKLCIKSILESILFFNLLNIFSSDKIFLFIIIFPERVCFFFKSISFSILLYFFFDYINIFIR